MKTIIGIMFLMVVLITPGRMFSQSLNETDWQRQNPPSIYIDEKLYFGDPISEVGKKRSTIVAMRMNYTPYSTTTPEILTGNWQQSGNNVIFNFSIDNVIKNSPDTITVSYKIIWLTSNKIKLIDKNGAEIIYAKQGSADDHYAENLFK
jgi:hypothetical protein